MEIRDLIRFGTVLGKAFLVIACLVGAVLSANEVRLRLLARLSPEAALAVDPAYAPALLRRGDLMFASSPEQEVDQRLAMARLALRDEPLAASAVRQIGLIVDRDQVAPTTRPYMALASDLSRREGVAQLWLAQDRFKAGDVLRGMAYIDTVMRVHRDAYDLVFPLLARFTSLEGMARALALRSDAGGAWVADYLMYEHDRNGNMRVVADVLQSVGKPKRLPQGSNIAGETLHRLATGGEGDRARQLYNKAIKTGLLSQEGTEPGIRARGAAWRLFGWPEAAAEWRERPGSPILDILAEAGARRVVAQQVRFDRPGAYRWNPQLINPNLPPGSRVELTLRCAADKPAVVVWSAIAGAIESEPAVEASTVKSDRDCAAPIYSLELVGPDAGGPFTASLAGLDGPRLIGER